MLLELLCIQGPEWDVGVRMILEKFIPKVESLGNIQKREDNKGECTLGVGSAHFFSSSFSWSLLCSYFQGNTEMSACIRVAQSLRASTNLHNGYIFYSIFSVPSWDLYSEVKERVTHFSESPVDLCKILIWLHRKGMKWVREMLVGEEEVEVGF